MGLQSKTWVVAGAFAAVSLTLGSASAPLAQQNNLSIERISSAPYPFDLTAAPSGRSVAWVYNERGARNVWVWDGATARRLTAYAGDNGVDIADLRWTGDASTLLYTLGGDGGGRTPVNPTSSPGGVKGGEIWAVRLSGGAPRRVGEGQSATPAPTGDRFVFVRGGQPFIAAASGGEAAPLFRDRGAVGGLTWSPDGGRLAFVSNRGAHSLVGVYDLAAKSITWISPGIDRDQMPVWSPGGDRIAFVRTASGEETSQGRNREGHPFEIWVSDSRTGAGRKIWTAKTGAGSKFRALFNSPTSLLWGADDQLIFPWEVTGWVRLYATPATGGEARLLTPGASEAFAAELTRDRSRVVYATNQDDIDRRHIWEVSVAGGPPKALSKSDGIEDFPAIAADGAVFALAAGPRRPLSPVQIANGRIVELAPDAIPAEFPTNELIEPKLVTFKAADGVTVHGQLLTPKNLDGKKAPALLFFHGGPTNRQTFAGFDSFETHDHLYQANQFLAANGYVVLSINYRGGAGYGLDFREAKDFGVYGASELNDIVGAARYLQSLPSVDSKRMGVWGGSYGGRMTSLAMARAPEFWVAGADYAGVHDMRNYYSRFLKTPEEREVAYQSSAIAHVDKWKAPVLLMVGDADSLTPDTISLAAALRDKGVTVDQVMIPDEVHFLLRRKSWHTIFQATKDYLDKHLKP